MTGGEAKRLTYHSTREVPSSFTADDKAVLFNAARQDSVNNAQFPIGLMSELYSVPVGGGRVSQVLTTPALDATATNPGGSNSGRSARLVRVARSAANPRHR